MNAVLHELKHALRATCSQPGFSILLVTVLAAGLACVIYMFIALGSMVIRPLPFPHSEQLETVGLDDGSRGSGNLDAIRSNDLLQLRRHLTGLAEVAGFETATINLSDLDRPERFDGALVTGNLLHVLGVAPMLGRDFSVADERDGAPPVVMLSHDLWTSRYGADPAILGRQVRVNAENATVIGVMPQDFSYPRREVVWVPGRFTDGVNTDAEYVAVLRQAAGTDANAVHAAIASWFADSARAEPQQFRGEHVRVEALSLIAVNGGTRAVLGVMLVAALLVLLIACANAANLLLTRTLARRQELAIRVALGASRGRLIVHLIAQSLLLTMTAAAVALVLARAAATWTEAAFRAADDGPPHWIHFNLDATVVWMTIVVAVVTALAAGLLPALRAGGSAMAGDLRDGTRTAGGGFARTSRVLVIAEVALSLALLMTVGTLVGGIAALDQSNLGIDPQGILTARIGLFAKAHPTGADQVRLFERISDRLRADPAVIDATTATSLPGLNGNRRSLLPAGDVVSDGTLPSVLYSAVDDHFLSTYGISLLEGRFFDSRDTTDATAVAVVDRRFAERYGANASVIGRRFRLDPHRADGPLVTIVGVLPNIAMDQPGQPLAPSLLVPLRQQPARFVSLALRVQGDPAAFAPQLSERIRDVDADTPAYWVRTYDQTIREATFGTRMLIKMFGTFGLLALALAAAGLYGVIAFNVGQRTREIGVRRALGAPSASVLHDVLKRASWQVGIGLALGLAFGMGLTHALTVSLHGVAGGDPASVLGAVAVLLLAAAIAVVVPARRALRIDPMIALRHE